MIQKINRGDVYFYNFGFDYVSALAKNFYGINDVQLVKAEGLDIYGADVSAIMQTAKNSFKLN